jgi:hypothetical protein
MSQKDRLEMFEHHAAILERVAKQYTEGSAEHSAIRQAAIALWYALSQHGDDFLARLDQWERGDLSPEQVAHLKSMGIDPDAIDD